MQHQSRSFFWQHIKVAGLAARSMEGDGGTWRLALAIALITISAVVIALATGLIAKPRGAPFASDSASPVEQVIAAATTWSGPADDPAITLPSGVQVKSSNYNGLQIGDTTYYYDLAPRVSYDPLARGDVSERQVHVVAVVGDAPQRVMIYTIPSGISPLVARVSSSQTGSH
jgi:hypothetical protein